MKQKGKVLIILKKSITEITPGSEEDASIFSPADIRARNRILVSEDVGTLQPDKLPPDELSLEARRKCKNPV